MIEIQEILQNKIDEYKKRIPMQKEIKHYKLDSMKESKKLKKKGIKVEEYCIDVSYDFKNEVRDISKDIENSLKEDRVIYLMMGNDDLEEENFFLCRIRMNNDIEITEYSFGEEIVDFKKTDNFTKMCILNIKLIKTDGKYITKIGNI